MSKSPSPSSIEFPKEDEDRFYDVLHGHPKPKSRIGRMKDYFWQFLLCCLWKPCPPYLPMVIDKFAFEAKKPTYYFVLKTEPVCSSDKIKEVYEIRLRKGCEVLLTESNEIPAFFRTVNGYYIKPSHTKRLACRYIKSCHFPSPPNFVVFFCHANAADLGFDLNMHYYFARRMNCDFFTFDYCGYGQSSGSCSETNFYLDTTAAYEFLVNCLNVSPDKIVVFGQSLGTVAAIDLVSKNDDVKGLILDGLFLSAARILLPTLEKNFCCDKFVSAKKVPLIQCPTLIIHGALDPITHLANVEQFFGFCSTLVPPLIIPSGEHLDLMIYRCYWNRLEIFFEHELKLGKMPFKKECSPHCGKDHTSGRQLGLMHMRLKWPFKIIQSKNVVNLENVFPNS